MQIKLLLRGLTKEDGSLRCQGGIGGGGSGCQGTFSLPSLPTRFREELVTPEEGL